MTTPTPLATLADSADAAIRSWHELEYAVLEHDSGRILADALTPQAAALLSRIVGAHLDGAAPQPRCSTPWTVTEADPTEHPARQRSPPTR